MKIVSLLPSATEIVYSLGLGDSLEGVPRRGSGIVAASGPLSLIARLSRADRGGLVQVLVTSELACIGRSARP